MAVPPLLRHRLIIRIFEQLRRIGFDTIESLIAQYKGGIYLGIVSSIIGIIAILGSIIMLAGLLPGNLFIILTSLSIIGLLLGIMDRTKHKSKILGLIINSLNLILLLLTSVSLLKI